MKKVLTFISVYSKWFILGMLAILLIIPLFVKSQYIMRVVMLCLINSMLAVSLNLLVGFLGQMSFGHAAFYGIGAYTTALIAIKLGITDVLVVVPCSMIVAGFLGMVLSLPVLKLKGYYLAIVTMGFCEIVRLVELNWMSLTNGPLGLKPIPKPSIFGIKIHSQVQLYYYEVMLVVFVTYVVWAVIKSRTGRAIRAIHDNDLAATSVGIHAFKYRVITFVLSAMLGSIAGSFYAQYSWYIDPTLFTSSVSTQMNLMTILGGLGNIVGSFLGAIIMTVLPEALRFLTDYRMLIYGVLMVVIIVNRPQGILGNVDFEYLKQRALAARNNILPKDRSAKEEKTEAKEIRRESVADDQQILTVRNVTQRFGGLVALENIQIEISKGEIVGIIGPNGAGKTTLFNVVTGIYRPTEGSVFFCGKDVTGMKPHAIASLGLGRTFQNIRLFDRMSVLDNVVAGMHTKTKANLFDALLRSKRMHNEEQECREKAVQLLKLVELYDSRHELASSLPYGKRRRLEIARALALNPKLLLLDEPAAGMNEQETEELRTIVKSLNDAGYTILLIEHDMKFVMNICDKIYVLNYGKQIAVGKPEEVSKNPEVIKAYLGQDDDNQEAENKNHTRIHSANEGMLV